MLSNEEAKKMNKPIYVFMHTSSTTANAGGATSNKALNPCGKMYEQPYDGNLYLEKNYFQTTRQSRCKTAGPQEWSGCCHGVNIGISIAEWSWSQTAAGKKWLWNEEARKMGRFGKARENGERKGGRGGKGEEGGSTLSEGEGQRLRNAGSNPFNVPSPSVNRGVLILSK